MPGKMTAVLLKPEIENRASNSTDPQSSVQHLHKLFHVCFLLYTGTCRHRQRSDFVFLVHLSGTITQNQ